MFVLRVRVPDHEIVVNRDHAEDPYVALRDAFDVASRRLEDLAARCSVATSKRIRSRFATSSRGVRIDEDYGFIETDDGNEYYFGRDNVVDPSFEARRWERMCSSSWRWPRRACKRSVTAGKHHALA